MNETEDILSPEQRQLFNAISHTTVLLWQHAEYIKPWFRNDVWRLQEYLALNAMDRDSRFLFGGCYVRASVTVH